jgi:hypothetical protein
VDFSSMIRFLLCHLIKCSLILFFILIMCLFILIPSVNANFSPELLSKSTVRILIKTKQGVVGAATGFLWENNTQVVTSLHVLSPDPNSKIIVEFGKKKRKAKVKAILPGADLVLLEINKPIAGWIPLTNFEGEKPAYKDEVSALGFNQGSIGMSTRELRKGFVQPEMLQVLLPPAALKKIRKSNILDVTLPIYYLDGSLLPGYSGSPIVNDLGTLIGIGDGGLENGAASVSWVIPASNLKLLMESTITQLPSYLGTSNEIFSADRLEGKKSNRHAGLYMTNWSIAEVIRSMWIPSAYAGEKLDSEKLDSEEAGFIQVDYQQFQFIKVKTRSYQQLLNSSGSPTDMNKVFELFNTLFYGYRVDYEALQFDIYEDARYSLNIAVPSGVSLTVDKNGFLLAQGKMFCRTCNYEIQYHARSSNKKAIARIKKSPYLFLNNIADQHWQDLNEEGEYDEYDDFRTIENFGGGRYVLRAAYSDLAESFKEKYEINYFTAATNRESWFQAQGILNRFDDDFIDDIDDYRGTDCTAANLKLKQINVCHDIETMLHVMISVHLTSFSNKPFYF